MILLSNDDGVRAEGLQALARALHEAGYDITVLAPSEERSGVGHSMSFYQPHVISPFREGYPEGVPAYSCNGTPSDCVLLGLEVVAPAASMVMTGINRGANLGDDMTYSGTVGAAMEALITGRQSIALSLAFMKKEEQRPDFHDPISAHFPTAAQIGLRVLKWLEKNDLPKGVLLNVNVPNLPLEQVKGILITRQGSRLYADRVKKTVNADGTFTYWVTGKVIEALQEGTDVWAVAKGYASVTPVHLNFTHFPSLNALKTLETVY